jgi:hypothetical protein
MTDIYQTIESALDYTLSNITDIPIIVFENGDLVVSSTDTYLEPVFSPTIRKPAVRGVNPQQYYQGLYRVEVNTPKGIGRGPANLIASKIITAFEATTDISYGGKIISIRYVEKETGAENDASWNLPVNIGWYIYD